MREFFIAISKDKTIIDNLSSGIISFYRDQYGNVKLYGLPFVRREYNFLGEKNVPTQDTTDLSEIIEQLWIKFCPIHAKLQYNFFPNIQGMIINISI